MSASPETLLELRDVDFGYGERLILSNLNMRFGRGQVVAVMGGSGCGKTTVLRLIGGLVKARRGQVLFGSVLSGVAAYLSVRFLSRYFEKNSLRPFGWYCVVAGAAALILVNR